MLVPAELTAAIKSPGSQQELHSQQCNGLAWGQKTPRGPRAGPATGIT